MKTASEMTNPKQKRSVVIVFGVVVGCFIGGLIGSFGYDALINSEQNQAMNDYLLGIPGVVDSGLRLVRTGIGSACGATIGLVLGALVGRRRQQGIEVKDSRAS